MQRRERLRDAVGAEGIRVGEDGRDREGRRQRADELRVQPPLPGEVAGQEGEHEEAHVAGVEPTVRVQVHPEERRQLHRDRRRRREREGDQGVPPAPPRRLARVRGNHDELLPEPVRVLDRELPRQGVQVAHPLDRHQERLVGGEPRVGEGGDLLAQVVLQLRHVDGVDGAAAAEKAPPLVDLRLERRLVSRIRHGHAPCGSGTAEAGRDSACQMPRSVASTACHCLRSSSSCPRPRSVIP